MKGLLIIFGGLFAAFCATWAVKADMPINKPVSIDTETQLAWYENTNTMITADSEWYLDPEIPVNYIPVPGQDEVYMVIDDAGNVIQYRQRIQDANGEWFWHDVVDENIPDNMTPAPGADNLYQITDEEGNTSYQLYRRNEEDNSYCFVLADENGVPYYEGSDATVIDDSFIRLTGNIYELHNDNGVVMGYGERVKDENGNYIWKDVPKPDVSIIDGITSLEELQQQEAQSNNPDIETTIPDYNPGVEDNNNQSTQQNSDGTYTVTKKETTTETVDGESVVYETTYYYTYSNDGTLLSTKKGQTIEVSRTATGTGGTKVVDQSLIQNTLDGELARVSTEVKFNTTKANEVLAALNAQRASQGLPQLTMDTSSDAYKLACIRVADMAIYNASSTTSAMYGTLNDMVNRWNVSHSKTPSENVWGTPSKSASEIHSRFQAVDGMRNLRMSAEYTSVAIAIVDTAEGQTYIAEIYLD